MLHALSCEAAPNGRERWESAERGIFYDTSSSQRNIFRNPKQTRQACKSLTQEQRHQAIHFRETPHRGGGVGGQRCALIQRQRKGDIIATLRARASSYFPPIFREINYHLL